MLVVFFVVQTPCALMSSLASFVVFAVLLVNSSSVNYVHFDSISMSLQTSDNIFAVRSLRSLCLIDMKPPFLQLIQCCKQNLLPQGHVAGKFAMLHRYRNRIASQKCCFDSSKPKSLIDSAVSTNLIHLSLCLHQVIFRISLIDYFLIEISWCGIDLTFLFYDLFSCFDLS